MPDPVKATCCGCKVCAVGWRNSKRLYRVHSDEDCVLIVHRWAS